MAYGKGTDMNLLGAAQRAEFDQGLSEFFDPSVDEHSEFYCAMQRDKNAAHLVAGTSFLSLNNVILTTECNNAYESMNEDDMQKLRKLMWSVYVPTIQKKMSAKLALQGDTTDQFKVQMYVVHLSIRVAQALQLIFELNQKKSFSPVAKTAFEVALQDVLYHPNLKGRVESYQYHKLINFLRRHPTYSTAFNTYVGYKLLRQQLVRSGGAGTNRKSNDAERLHDEAANRLWGVLSENRDVFSEFQNALSYLTMEWHDVYYKEVAETLFSKLTGDVSTNAEVNDDFVVVQGGGQQPAGLGAAAASVLEPRIDIVSAIQEIRANVSEGPSKRSSVSQMSLGTRLTVATDATTLKRQCTGENADATTTQLVASSPGPGGDTSVPAMLRVYQSMFQ
mgnify:CR=1 FL=1|jgi:hypothetical protein